MAGMRVNQERGPAASLHWHPAQREVTQEIGLSSVGVMIWLASIRPVVKKKFTNTLPSLA